jgi:hypothetical protein
VKHAGDEHVVAAGTGQHAGQQAVGVRERQYQRDVEHEGEDEVPSGEQRERKKDARRQHKGGMRRDEVENERGALGHGPHQTGRLPGEELRRGLRRCLAPIHVISSLPRRPRRREPDRIMGPSDRPALRTPDGPTWRAWPCPGHTRPPVTGRAQRAEQLAVAPELRGEPKVPSVCAYVKILSVRSTLDPDMHGWQRLRRW